MDIKEKNINNYFQTVCLILSFNLLEMLLDIKKSPSFQAISAHDKMQTNISYFLKYFSTHTCALLEKKEKEKSKNINSQLLISIDEWTE